MTDRDDTRVPRDPTPPRRRSADTALEALVLDLRANVAGLESRLDRLVDGEGNVTCRSLTAQAVDDATIRVVSERGDAALMVETGTGDRTAMVSLNADADGYDRPEPMIGLMRGGNMCGWIDDRGWGHDPAADHFDARRAARETGE